jgi:hypothetical protein
MYDQGVNCAHCWVHPGLCRLGLSLRDQYTRSEHGSERQRVTPAPRGTVNLFCHFRLQPAYRDFLALVVG